MSANILRPAVLRSYHDFSEPLEGRINHMYLDVLGLVTTGVGNLIDSPTNLSAGLGAALSLPWIWPASGQPATLDEIEKQWRALRANAPLAKRATSAAKQYLASRFGAALVLKDEDIDALVLSKLTANAAAQAKDFPLATWPADAQLVLMSMTWAMGSDFDDRWPAFVKACLARDWARAAKECEINAFLPPKYPAGHPKANPGVVPRNALNVAHLLACAYDNMGDEWPDVLHGPCKLSTLRAGWVLPGAERAAQLAKWATTPESLS